MSEPVWVALGAVPSGSVVWAGLWSAGVTYQPGMLITYGGKFYIASAVSTGSTPPP
jgi:NO-binding membrane sensor protein with MHYT domain